MKDKTSLLFSNYILDGVQMEQTPFSALYDCLDGNGTVDTPAGPFADIVDEYMDKAPHCFSYDPSLADEYAAQILRTAANRRKADLRYPALWTVSAIDSLLLDALFRDGHFTLSDMLVMARWDWCAGRTGNLAAFWESTSAAGTYLFDLGVKLDRYFVEENRRECTLELSLRNKVGSRRKCPDTMQPDPSDWLIYIPFSTARLHLGGSALSQVVGHDGGAEMDLMDADYFIDCYEVVRELVEDGVITAGVPIGRGGLFTAAEKFRGRRGMGMEIGGIMASTGESEEIKVLFSELPGVLVQIRDDDYDYVDAQMLLQEISYYPIGHPDPESHCIKVSSRSRDNISSILASLMHQTTEGED